MGASAPPSGAGEGAVWAASSAATGLELPRLAMRGMLPRRLSNCQEFASLARFTLFRQVWIAGIVGITRF